MFVSTSMRPVNARLTDGRSKAPDPTLSKAQPRGEGRAASALKLEQEGWSNRPSSLAYHVDDISLTLGTYVLADLVVWIQVSDSLNNPRFRVCRWIFNRELNFQMA